MDNDLALALQLQDQFDNESHGVSTQPTCSSSDNGKSKLSLADESWELIDPNPDIRTLFLQFNDQFFWGRLAGIEVKWSPRMTLCAGLCVYEGRGGLCSVRLSSPLLKLRPRKDLVETLLHEMIHAYLFVTDNNKDHDGHGPEFHKHMYRINKEAGVNITVYHSFHDEVAEYRQHWWRCTGPCQNRKPFFGYVKRAMNRAPGPNDTWWNDHKNSCNGTFIKIKEPDNYGKKKKKEKLSKQDNEKNLELHKKGKNMDIRVFVGKGHILSESSSGHKSTEVSQQQSIISSSSDSEDSSDSFDQFLKTVAEPEESQSSLPTCTNSMSGSQLPSSSGTSRDLTSDLEIGSYDNYNETLSKTVKNVRKSGTSISEKFVVLSDSDEELITEVSEKLLGSSDNESQANKSQYLENSQIDTGLREPRKPESDVQLKLREIWGARFNSDTRKGKKLMNDFTKSHGKSLSNSEVNASSRKRLLDKEDTVSANKRMKTEDLDMRINDRSDVFRKTSDQIVVTSPPTSKEQVTSSQTREERHCSCPVCSQHIPLSQINQHLDNCLGVT